MKKKWKCRLQGWGEGLGLLFLVGWPVAFALLFPPTGWQLARPWYYGGDFSQYLSAMRQGMSGSWLIVNRFSPEPHLPALQYPFYVLLGHLARLLRVSPEILYGAAAGIGFLALWEALNRFFAFLLPASAMRRIAIALVFSSGPAWILPLVLLLARSPSPWGNAALDAATRIEHNTFLALMAPPHLMLALALWLRSIPELSQPPTRFSPRSFMGMAIVLILLALLNPFSMVPFLVGVGVRTLLGVWESRRAAIPGLMDAMALGLLAAPLISYQWNTFHRDPFWGVTYGAQNIQPAYPLPLSLLAYGWIGIAGLIGALRAWIPGKWSAGFRERFLSLMVGGLLLTSGLPLPYARRFMLGLGPLLTALATPITADLLKHPRLKAWRRAPPGRVIGGIGLGIMFYSQNAFLYAIYALSLLGTGPFPRTVFEPTAAFEAAAWLRSQGPGIVVLACEDDGNFLAGYIEGRVVLGHAGATFQVAQKRQEVAAFFSGRLSMSEQQALIWKYRVTHIYSREDRPCYRWRSTGVPVFEQPPVRIFRVEGTP